MFVILQLSGRIERLDSDVAGLRREITGDGGLLVGFHQDIFELRDDVTGIEVKVDKLQTDVSGLKTDVSELKSDMADVKGSLKEIWTGCLLGPRRTGRGDRRAGPGYSAGPLRRVASV
jgi:hypothetical protein